MTHSVPLHAGPANSRRWLVTALLSFGVALAVVSPFFWLGNASGHDIAFHASSWMDVAAQWKEGVLFPRWTEWANYGYGEPRFIFYPPISRLIGAVAGVLFGWVAAAPIFIILVQTFSGISAYALVRRFAPHPRALLGAACYAANPNSLLIIYVRSDYAELLAIAFYPLLILAAMQLCGWLLPEGRAATRSILFFALPFAAVWLSNAPAGAIATYSVAGLFVCAAILCRSWRTLFHGLAALVLGFGLSSFYLYPAGYEQRWVNIGQALSAGLAPADNFLFAAINDPDHNAFNRIASSVAVLLIAMTLLAVVAAWRRTDQPHRRPTWLLALLGAASTLLMFRITQPLWNVLPELRFVQFPWRWMSMLALIFSVFFAIALAGRRRSWVWAVLVFLLLGGTATYLGWHTWWDQDDFPTVQGAIAQGQGFEGTDEYDPLGDDHLDLPQNQPQARLLPADNDSQVPSGATFHVERWLPEDRVISVSTTQRVLLAVRLLDYPAWAVTVNGYRIALHQEDGIAAMFVALEPGTSRVEMRFLQTRDRKFANCTNLIALLAAVLLAVFPMKSKG